MAYLLWKLKAGRNFKCGLQHVLFYMYSPNRPASLPMRTVTDSLDLFVVSV